MFYIVLDTLPYWTAVCVQLFGLPFNHSLASPFFGLLHTAVREVREYPSSAVQTYTTGSFVIKKWWLVSLVNFASHLSSTFSLYILFLHFLFFSSQHCPFLLHSIRSRSFRRYALWVRQDHWNLSVKEYTDGLCQPLETDLLAAMHHLGAVLTIGNEQEGYEWDIVVCAGNICWWHRGGRMATETSWLFRNIGTLQTNCSQEACNERHLGDIINRICGVDKTDLLFILDEIFTLFIRVRSFQSLQERDLLSPKGALCVQAFWYQGFVFLGPKKLASYA